MNQEQEDRGLAERVQQKAAETSREAAERIKDPKNRRWVIGGGILAGLAGLVALLKRRR